MTAKLSEAISKMINPDSGSTHPLTENNKHFVAKYQEGLSNLTAEEQPLRNVISKEGQCGFVNNGSIDYLLNTDSGNRYRVTVRTYWQGFWDSGQYDQIYINEAGGKLKLGCTQSDDIPITYYNRQVVGEVRIET
jgi:hypothetical protein